MYQIGHNYSIAPNELESDYERHKGTFWGYVVVYMLISIRSVVGNCFVLFATYGNSNSGPLRYLDSAIKSLAVTDMLFGLIAAPCRVFIDYKIG